MSLKGVTMLKVKKQMGRPCLTQEHIDNLCKEFIEYAESPDSLTLGGFSASKRKTYTWAIETARDYPQFKEAYEIARNIIGNRRETLGLKKILSEKIVEKTMPMYNSEYRELVLQLTKVQAENERIIQFVSGKKPIEVEE
jgi:hypothetical protein